VILRLRRVAGVIYPPIFFFLFLLIAWQLYVEYTHYPRFLLPTPYEIMSEFLISWPTLVPHFIATLLEIVSGFFVGSIIGVILGIWVAYSKLAERVIYPLAILVKVAPVVAIAPMITLWFGFGILSKIVITSIISFFPLVLNMSAGLTSIDPSLVDLMHSLSAKETEIFLKIRLPNSVPYAFAGLKIAITVSVVGAIVAEFAGALAGLGFMANMAMAYIETPLLFVLLMILSFLGIALFGMISMLERIFVPWAAARGAR